MLVLSSASNPPLPGLHDVELPRFCVIVGPNGVGKTQLLRGIKEGRVHVRLKEDGVETPVRASILMDRGGASRNSPPQPWEAASDPIPDFETQFAAYLQAARGVAIGDVRRSRWSVSPHLEWLGLDELLPTEWLEISREAESPRSDLAKTLLDAFRQVASMLGGTGMPGDVAASAMRRAIVVSGLHPAQITWDVAAKAMRTPIFDPFTLWFPSLVEGYRDRHMRNDLKLCQDERDGTHVGLSPDAFADHYGMPPWERLTEYLGRLGLRYEVVSPNLYDPTTRYLALSLRRTVDGVIVAPSSLSSGEAVLLDMALALVGSDLGKPALPDLLLLDEMDASLHPEMIRIWLNALRTGIHDDLGVACILTTHSPVTVALAPEDAIYEMSSDNEPVIRRVSKQAALNRLSVGIPTVAIDFSGRRQVFCEDDVDANIYQDLFSMVQAGLDLPRSLSFLSSGVPSTGTGAMVNTGCSVVQKIVPILAENGNRSTFGLIDWDGRRSSIDRIAVLAEGTHYSLENLLLDPLLIGALLVAKKPTIFGDGYHIASLGNADGAKKQALADAVSIRLGHPPNRVDGWSQNEYLGGFEVRVPTFTRIYCGHDFEAFLRQSFHELNAYNRGGAGALMRAIVEHVISGLPDWLPRPIADIFCALSKRELGG